MDYFLTVFSIFTILGIFLFALDDIFLDLAALILKARPTPLIPQELKKMHRAPKKRFAILIANWKEEEVLERMVQGNLSHLSYSDFRIFLGVYPNDAPTWEAAKRLERRYSKVSVIMNHLKGPTSKGQLLNEMARKIIASERKPKLQYDAFLLQDSEDLIHPESLYLLNWELNQADFVQIPVFSLEVPHWDLTAGTYADEFAESHTKNLLVREKLGAAVPSAGVGTAISRSLLFAIQEKMHGNFLNEATLTEDYQLGIMAHRLGFKTRFSCRYLTSPSAGRDYIATREFFPEKISTSIRQKTRWTAGIAFQGTKSIGWSGQLIDRYFFWRDRRGPLNGVLMSACLLLLGIFLVHYLLSGESRDPVQKSFLSYFLAANSLQMSWRLLARLRCSVRVYGWSFAILMPARWMLANFINTIAAWKAYRSYHASVRSGQPMAWVKTMHRLPSGFGASKKTLGTKEKVSA